MKNGKKKTATVFPEINDDFWNGQFKRGFNFDDENDESNKNDFLEVENHHSSS